MNKADLGQAAWPLHRLGEAIEVLARHAGMALKEADVSMPDSFSIEKEHSLSFEEIDKWLEWACNELAIESELLETSVPELGSCMKRMGPSLIRLVQNERFHVLLLLKVRSGSALLVGPDKRLVKCPLAALHGFLLGPLEEAAFAEAENVLTNMPHKNKHKIRKLLIAESISALQISGVWMLRAPPAGSIWPQLRDEKLHSKLITVIALSIGIFGIEILAWSMIGKGALGGQLDFGWLLAWAFLLLTTVVLGLCVQWVQGMFSIGFGTVLKHRLLAGALRMKSDTLRSLGVGQLLGRVIESQSFDSLVLGGGLGLLVGLLELGIAAWVLSIGAGGPFHVLLLLAWIFCLLLAFYIFYKRHRCWTKSRLYLTHDLVEKMVGHRTRLVQELPNNRHLQEDQQIERYLEDSKHLDQSSMPLAAGIGRGWLVVGLLGLAPAFASDSGSSVGLAIGVGGVMLAHRAFSGLVDVGASVVQAVVAWEHLGELFKASAQTLERGMPLNESKSCGPNGSAADWAEHNDDDHDAAGQAQVLLQASDLSFRYPGQSKPVLDECNLTIFKGDNVLLEGPSGGGKSTLAALLSGSRCQDSGLLLLNGLDRISWGNSWRKQSTSAPQFHENHIISGTLAFNLLMGRAWPASSKDMAEAHILCLQLGLGNLLNRMPSGLLQMVGESGWQLSHGERSRVYLARALLQNADLVVLDESFAALDPQTLTQCLKCALARAPSLLVIAHP